MKKQIAYLTDIHLDEQFIADLGVDSRANWKKVLDDVRSRNITNLVFGGDIGEFSSNAWFFDSIRDFNVNITLGNHDRFAEAGKHFSTPHFGGHDELHYAFEEDGVKYIFLDSSSHAISPTQFEWLRKELVSDSRILLFLHHPVIFIGTNLELYWPLKEREKVLQLLQNSGKQITVFCGHYHTDDERSEGGVRQIITPAASYQTKRKQSVLDIPGFTRAYMTPDGGTTWNAMEWTVEEVPDEDTVVVTNATTFGYRIITIHDLNIDTELLLFRDGRFQRTSAPHYS